MNNREIALLVWIILFFGWALLISKKSFEFRQNVIYVLKAILAKKLLIIFSLVLIYIIFELYLMHLCGVINNNTYKESILWTSIAFSSVMKITNSENYKTKLIGIIKSVFTLSILLEYIANLYSFSLIAELILTPFLICLSLISVVAHYRHEHKHVERISQGIIFIYVIYIIVFSTIHAINDSSIEYHTEVVKLLIPFILTILYLPFPYLFFLYCEHENIRVTISCRSESKNLKNAVTLSVIKKFGLNLFTLEKWRAKSQLYTIRTKDDINRVINTPI